jgi:CBS domain-containing protein
MLVREFMHSPAVTCASRTTLEAAAREMSHRNVGSLVVVSDNGNLTGIVTDRDIAVKGMGGGLTSTTPVTEVMSEHVITISPNSDVFSAAKKMSNEGVRRIPVVDASGALVGIIALDDVMAALSQEMIVLREAVATQMTGGPGWDR